MRSLKPSSEDNDQLPFTMASDAYAFGYDGAAKIPLLIFDYFFKRFIELFSERCGTSYSAANGPTRSIALRP